MSERDDMKKRLSGVFEVDGSQLSASKPVFARIHAGADTAPNGNDVVLLFGADFQGRDFIFSLSPDAAFWLAGELTKAAKGQG